jgi:hypothetical protein
MLVKKHNIHDKDIWYIYFLNDKDEVEKSHKTSKHEDVTRKSYAESKHPTRILYHQGKVIESFGDSKLIEICKDKADRNYDHRPNGFNGIKNFPKLLLKLMLNHEYVYDYITYWTLAAEIYPEKIVNTPYVNFGAAAGTIAALISKGQDLRA